MDLRKQCFQPGNLADSERREAAETLSRAAALRATLRGAQPTPSVGLCGRKCYTTTPGVVVERYGDEVRARWSGVATCHSGYACPYCSVRRGWQRCQRLDAMMRADARGLFGLWVRAGRARCLPRQRGQRGRWQMLTLTLRHRRGERLRDLLGVLFDSWRAVRSHRWMREIFDERVSATARLVEGTFSHRHSWHPHIHLLLRTDAWGPTELAMLEELWCDAVGADRYHPEHSVHWSDAFEAQQWEDDGCAAAKRARYLAKYVAGVKSDETWTDETGCTHFHPFDLARNRVHDTREVSGLDAYRAGLQDTADDMGPQRHRVRLWEEYATDMRGRRLLELDSRATALAFLGEELPPEPDDAAEVTVHSKEVRDLGRCERIPERDQRARYRRRAVLYVALWEVADSLAWSDNLARDAPVAVDDMLGEWLQRPSGRAGLVPGELALDYTQRPGVARAAGVFHRKRAG